MFGGQAALLLVCTASIVAGDRAPVLSVSGAYHGTVGEDGGVVEVSPAIRADNGPICGYRIVATHHGKLPFEIFMLDQETGTAQLKTRRPLNCEEKKNYVVTIAAVACTGDISESAEVRVTVKDVNEYIPEWSEEEYSASVEEGGNSKDGGTNILKVTATDRDCSPEFGDICSYAITSPDQPFSVDSLGVITSTKPLSVAESNSHVLSVVATDCGGKESSPVLVTITVLPKCTTDWADVSSSMTYIPGTGPQPVFPTSRLQLCPAVCPVARLETTLTLHTDHVGVGCDRDTYSLASQRKLCGASDRAVDLLPAEAEWVKVLKTDEGREASSMYEFDGTTGVKIPQEVIGHKFGDDFTVATWMRHEARPEGKHSKEHILCIADDHRKNRHHLALFVRNCKLVMLLRREYTDGEENVFRPAEWRWRLPQVCDNRWHHYAVSVSPNTMSLTVDGEEWHNEQDNPEIIDDWPLHPSSDLKTTMSVGACWQGAEEKFKHALKGYLAGLSVTQGRQEHSEVLRCLVQCSESLQLPATNLLEPGMEMVINSHGSQVTIDGDSAKNMEQLVHQVAYLNTREFPAPGRRRLDLATSITCQDGTKRTVPKSTAKILVLPVPQPTININGTDNVAREYEAFKRGVRIFADLRISVSRGDTEPVSGVETKVDRCVISVFPPLNPDHESVKLPETMLKTLNIAGSVGRTGGDISGADMIYNYEQVLRQVTYTNMKPAYYLNRQFKILCSELNERFVSNEYIQTLTVIHPPVNEGVVRPSHFQVSRHGAELPAAQMVSSRHEYMGAQSQGHAVVVVVVVCVGLLVAVLAVGVVRLRAAHRRAAQEEAEVEMAWDDTALNITVNPLEETECRGGEEERGGASDGGDDSSEDEDDMYGDDSSDDEEEAEVEGTPNGRHRLEWDNDM